MASLPGASSLPLQLQLACKVLFVPSSITEIERRSADEFLRDTLDKAARGDAYVVSAARAILADPSQSDATRSYACQCLQAGIGHQARTATAPEHLTPLQAVCMELVSHGSKGILSEAPYVKGRLGDAVSDAFLRCWPQRWPTAMDALLAAATTSPPAAELAAIVLTAIATTAGSSEFSGRLPPSRRSELVSSLTATAPSWASHFLGQGHGLVDTCCQVMTGVQQGAVLSPPAAAQLLSQLMLLCSSVAMFLPPSACRTLCPSRLLMQAWSATAQAAAQEGTTRVTVPLAEKVYSACISVLESLGARAWDDAGDADLACDAAAAALRIVAGSTVRGQGAGGTTVAAQLSPSLYRSLSCSVCEVLSSQWSLLHRGGRQGVGSVEGKSIQEGSNVSKDPSATMAEGLHFLHTACSHPSPILRLSSCGTLASILQGKGWAGYSMAGGWLPLAQALMAAMVREARFLLDQLPPAGRPRPPARAETVTPSLDALSWSRADVDDDDVEEARYITEATRSRAGKAIAALVHHAPDAVCQALCAASSELVSLCASPPAPPAGGTFYGGHALLTTAARQVEGMAYALLPTGDALSTYTATTLPPPCLSACHACAQSCLTLLGSAQDPWIRAAAAHCLGNMHGLLQLLSTTNTLPSLLPTVLEYLFTGVEYSAPAALVAAVDAAAAASGGGKSSSTAKDRVTFFRNWCQYARQRCCSALVSLSRRIPSILLPALQPMATRVSALLAGQGTAQADRVALYEALLLVSNALAEKDSHGHASFVSTVTAGPVHAWAGVGRALMGGQGEARALMAMLAIGGTSTEYGAFKTQAERLFDDLHICWAISRRCTASEMVHAVTGAHVLGSGVGEHGLGIPVHPFAAQWTHLAGPALSLLRALLSLWRPDNSRPLCSLSLPLAGEGGLSVWASCMLAVSPDEQRALQHVGRGDIAPKRSGGPGGGEAHAGDSGHGDARGEDGGDEDDDDEGEEGDGGESSEEERGNTAGARVTTLNVPTVDASGTVVPVPHRVPASVSLHAAWLASWYGRTLWHALALTATAAEAHVQGRKTASPLVAIEGIPESMVHAVWAPSGLWSPPVSPLLSHLSSTLSEAGTLACLPTRIVKHAVMQLCTGLVVGCPPTPTCSLTLSTLLLPLVREACARLHAVHTPQGGVGRHVGPVLTRAGKGGKGKSELMCEAVVRGAARAVMDLCCTLLPPLEHWYTVAPAPRTASSTGGDAVEAEGKGVPMRIPGSHGDMMAQHAAPTEPGTGHVPTYPPTMVNPPPFIPPAPTLAPVISLHVLLAGAQEAQVWGSSLALPFLAADTIALKKCCTFLSRLLPMLSAALLGCTSASTSTSRREALAAWMSACVQWFARGVQAMVTGEGVISSAENELAAALADVYCRCSPALGFGLQHPGPAVPGHTAHTVYPCAPLAIPGSATVRDVLLQALTSLPSPSPSPDHTATRRVQDLEGRVGLAGSEKERRVAVRELLQDMAASYKAHGGSSNAVSTSVLPQHTSAGASSARGGAVQALPETCTVKGGPRGAGGVQTGDADIGLQALFAGDEDV